MPTKTHSVAAKAGIVAVAVLLAAAIGAGVGATIARNELGDVDDEQKQRARIIRNSTACENNVHTAGFGNVPEDDAFNAFEDSRHSVARCLWLQVGDGVTVYYVDDHWKQSIIESDQSPGYLFWAMTGHLE